MAAASTGLANCGTCQVSFSCAPEGVAFGQAILNSFPRCLELYSCSAVKADYWLEGIDDVSVSMSGGVVAALPPSRFVDWS